MKATLHDYTQRYWGHDYTWSPDPGSGGRSGKATGWGKGIKVGDVIALAGPNGGGSAYRVTSISYYHDTDDMWSARLTYDSQ